MRLKSVYIGEYKNLKGFTLKFDIDSFIDVFVGKFERFRPMFDFVKNMCK